MIRSIHISRGLAALGVVVYHVYLIFLQKLGESSFEGIAKYGYLGVPYFFVLSGFIIHQAHRKDLGNPKAITEYAIKRAIRVYPIYWLFSAAFIAAAATGLGEPDFSSHPVHIAESAILIHFTPDFVSPPLKVAWTLFYEIRFYILFAIAILSPRYAIAIAAGWAVAIATVTPTNAFGVELLSYWNFAFLFGMLASAAYRKITSERWTWPTLAAGVTIIVLVFSNTDVLSLRDKNSLYILPTSLGFALVILGAALAERGGRMRVHAGPMMIGDASYSIYLVHSAAISALTIAIQKLPGLKSIPTALLFPLVALIAVTVGVAAHLWIEKPLLNAIKKVRAKSLETASA